MKNILGEGNLNEYWNVTYHYYNGYSIQKCNKYLDYFLSINGIPYVFKTDTEVKNFLDNL